MRILIVTAGTYEHFFSIAGQLLELGHEVYILHYDNIGDNFPGVKRDKIDPNACDLVITANIIESPYVLKTLGELQIQCPVISIVWGSPVAEIAPYWRNIGIAAVNKQLQDIGVHLWISCNRVEEDFRRLGFGASFYAPLGISDKFVWLSHTFRWLRKEMNVVQNISDLYGGMADPPELAGSKAQIVYRGILPKPPALPPTPDMEALAKETATECAGDPSISRHQLQQVWERLQSMSESERVEKYMIYDAWFNYHLARMTRRPFVQRLKREFKDRFLLFGDDWAKEGIEAEPTSIVNREVIYNRMPISIDFGSTGFETCFFPRPIEIVKVGGCLVAYRRPDSELFFGDNCAKMVFADADEMCERVDGLLQGETERELCRRKLRDDLLGNFGLNNILQDIIQRVVG